MKVFFNVLLLLVITNTYANVNTQNLSTLNFDNLEFTLSKNEIQQLRNTTNTKDEVVEEKQTSANNKSTKQTIPNSAVVKYLPVYIPIQIPVYKPIYVPRYIPISY